MKTPSPQYALRRADLEDGTCTVPDECAAATRVVLEHRLNGVTPARHIFDTVAEDGGDGLKVGVSWPEDIRVGVLVSVRWHPARHEVQLRTKPLDEPLKLDGVAYFHEYDPHVVTHEFTPANSNRGRVLDAVRRHGLVFADGSAVFPEADLVKKAGLGRGTRGMFLLRNAVDQLIREGYVTRVDGSLGAAGLPIFPAVQGAETVPMLFYAPLIEPAHRPEPDPAEASNRHDHWVTGFTRKLQPGTRPSPRALALHRMAIDSGQIPDAPLPDGYTFVKKHHRNG
ncbi:hypothetical protein [Dactylosporangium matsuzakiense]|uniref:Uncharacterized protein n=1 Tax=Dactylosporangium matsuzakiense TaxID=53360 RepID=A0A9W6NNJ7_9ACTN|nr:hypothetical protein [Dactylosporangium matsuzakiense]UWZ48039.1 hypothetical protein Dmats_17550 [Dactylosporangium matsuzakiense]GLL03524.1 hypothetical protein GCM10017581_052700 [Dactylosporangium matsuzakiense]